MFALFRTTADIFTETTQRRASESLMRRFPAENILANKEQDGASCAQLDWEGSCGEICQSLIVPLLTSVITDSSSLVRVRFPGCRTTSPALKQLVFSLCVDWGALTVVVHEKPLFHAPHPLNARGPAFKQHAASANAAS